MILTLIRIVKFGFQNFIRNFWLAVATVSVLVLTLISVNSLVIEESLLDWALRKMITFGDGNLASRLQQMDCE